MYQSWKHPQCKKQGKAGEYNTPKWWGPLRGPCVCGSFSAPGCFFFLMALFDPCSRPRLVEQGLIVVFVVVVIDV